MQTSSAATWTTKDNINLPPSQQPSNEGTDFFASIVNKDNQVATIFYTVVSVDVFLFLCISTCCYIELRSMSARRRDILHRLEQLQQQTQPTNNENHSIVAITSTQSPPHVIITGIPIMNLNLYSSNQISRHGEPIPSAPSLEEIST